MVRHLVVRQDLRDDPLVTVPPRDLVADTHFLLCVDVHRDALACLNNTRDAPFRVFRPADLRCAPRRIKASGLLERAQRVVGDALTHTRDEEITFLYHGPLLHDPVIPELLNGRGVRARRRARPRHINLLGDHDRACRHVIHLFGRRVRADLVRAVSLLAVHVLRGHLLCGGLRDHDAVLEVVALHRDVGEAEVCPSREDAVSREVEVSEHRALRDAVSLLNPRLVLQEPSRVIRRVAIVERVAVRLLPVLDLNVIGRDRDHHPIALRDDRLRLTEHLLEGVRVALIRGRLYERRFAMHEPDRLKRLLRAHHDAVAVVVTEEGHEVCRDPELRLSAQEDVVDFRQRYALEATLRVHATYLRFKRADGLPLDLDVIGESDVSAVCVERVNLLDRSRLH